MAAIAFISPKLLLNWSSNLHCLKLPCRCWDECCPCEDPQMERVARSWYRGSWQFQTQRDTSAVPVCDKTTLKSSLFPVWDKTAGLVCFLCATKKLVSFWQSLIPTKGRAAEALQSKLQIQWRNIRFGEWPTFPLSTRWDCSLLSALDAKRQWLFCFVSKTITWSAVLFFMRYSCTCFGNLSMASSVGAKSVSVSEISYYAMDSFGNYFDGSQFLYGPCSLSRCPLGKLQLQEMQAASLFSVISLLWIGIFLQFFLSLLFFTWAKCWDC